MLDMTGSGNETAAHLLSHPRMTLMFCTFVGGACLSSCGSTARSVWSSRVTRTGLGGRYSPLPEARQLLVLDLIQTSCGMAVPRLDDREQRADLNIWAQRRKTPQELGLYRQFKNRANIDGFSTGLPGGEGPNPSG